jgi:ankyrin repeat protein
MLKYIVRVLLYAKVDVTIRDKDGRTPLHWATNCGHPKIVKLSLGYKADVAVQDLHGLTALHYASRNG